MSATVIADEHDTHTQYLPDCVDCEWMHYVHLNRWRAEFLANGHNRHHHPTVAPLHHVRPENVGTHWNAACTCGFSWTNATYPGTCLYDHRIHVGRKPAGVSPILLPEDAPATAAAAAATINTLERTATQLQDHLGLEGGAPTLTDKAYAAYLFHDADDRRRLLVEQFPAMSVQITGAPA